MKKLLTIILGLIATLNYAQQGTILESQHFNSKILGCQAKYSIYLPADYQSSKRNYPVLYLLHGFTDNETAWIQFGEVKQIADKQIKSGESVQMIIVMPDAGISWYINSFDGKVNYEDFFVNELIPFIDSSYRTRPAKEFRAISGLSMGGFGTLLMALKHPELFSSAVPLSAGIKTEKEIIEMDDKKWDEVYGVPFGTGLKGNDRFTNHYQSNSILNIIKNKKTEELSAVRFYIDCGDKDFLIKGNMELHSLLTDKNIPHEFRIRKGEHNWTYWREALPEVLGFVSKGFHR